MCVCVCVCVWSEHAMLRLAFTTTLVSDRDYFSRLQRPTTFCCEPSATTVARGGGGRGGSAGHRCCCGVQMNLVEDTHPRLWVWQNVAMSVVLCVAPRRIKRIRSRYLQVCAGGWMSAAAPRCRLNTSEALGWWTIENMIESTVTFASVYCWHPEAECV